MQRRMSRRPTDDGLANEEGEGKKKPTHLKLVLVGKREERNEEKGKRKELRWRQDRHGNEMNRVNGLGIIENEEGKKPEMEKKEILSLDQSRGNPRLHDEIE